MGHMGSVWLTNSMSEHFRFDVDSKRDRGPPEKDIQAD